MARKTTEGGTRFIFFMHMSEPQLFAEHICVSLTTAEGIDTLSISCSCSTGLMHSSRDLDGAQPSPKRAKADSSQKLGELLLRGWTMRAESCPDCLVSRLLSQSLEGLQPLWLTESSSKRSPACRCL